MPSRDEAKRSKNVGFRLQHADFDRLAAAATRRGLSPGEYARLLVLDALDDMRGERLAAHVVAVGERAIEVKRGLAALALVTLTQLVKVDDKTARAWVHDQILNREMD